MKEFVAAAKAANSPFKMGGTGSKREDHVLTVFMEKRTGASSRICLTSPAARPRPSSSAITPPPTSTIHRRISRSGAPARSRAVRVRQGTDRLQGQGHRTQSWNDIPTCKDEGLDVQYLMLRAMFLPGKVTAEQNRVLRRSVQEGDPNHRIQGLYGEAGVQADLPHRARHGEIPRRGRRIQQVAS